jgi:hypothetical protein
MFSLFLDDGSSVNLQIDHEANISDHGILSTVGELLVGISRNPKTLTRCLGQIQILE